MPAQPESTDRRRQEREKYLVLRFYARTVSILGYIVLVVGALFAILVIPFADEPLPSRVSTSFMSAVMGGVYFVLLRATAQAIYLLFDMARNIKASRELLETKAGAPAAAPQPKLAPGD